MKLPLAISLTSIVIGFSFAASAAPVTYSGITFPDGDVSFADSVVSYSPGPNVDPPYNNSSRALGPPDGPGTSLGNGSEGDITDASLILRFDDNSLTPSGDSTADLHIFEGGPAVEEMEISISKDGQAWIFLGLLEGQPTSIDIDGTAGVAPGDLFRFVRLSDAGEGASGSPFGGADIDAVGAISSSFDVPDIPQIAAPAALPLLGLGLAALVAYRRR